MIAGLKMKNTITAMVIRIATIPRRMMPVTGESVAGQLGMAFQL